MIAFATCSLDIQYHVMSACCVLANMTAECIAVCSIDTINSHSICATHYVICMALCLQFMCVCTYACTGDLQCHGKCG